MTADFKKPTDQLPSVDVPKKLEQGKANIDRISQSFALTEGTRGQFLSPEVAQTTAKEITAEWGDAFPHGLDQHKVGEALQNYDAYTVEGIVSNGGDWEDPAFRTEWVHDRLDKLNQTADIPGMDGVAEHLTDDFASAKQQGAGFELDWIAAHANEVQSVGLVDAEVSGDTVRNIKEGIDVQIKDGSFVELKSYDFSRPYYQDGSGVEGVIKQLRKDVTDRQAHNVTVIFDTSLSEMPPAFKWNLDNRVKQLEKDLKKQGITATINWNTWPKER